MNTVKPIIYGSTDVLLAGARNGNRMYVDVLLGSKHPTDRCYAIEFATKDDLTRLAKDTDDLVLTETILHTSGEMHNHVLSVMMTGKPYHRELVAAFSDNTEDLTKLTRDRSSRVRKLAKIRLAEFENN